MEVIKNFFNIIFFATMSILAILSYLQARKTLFSPIKTEIFKLQVKELQEVINIFNNHNNENIYVTDHIYMGQTTI